MTEIVIRWWVLFGLSLLLDILVIIQIFRLLRGQRSKSTINQIHNNTKSRPAQAKRERRRSRWNISVPAGRRRG